MFKKKERTNKGKLSCSWGSQCLGQVQDPELVAFQDWAAQETDYYLNSEERFWRGVMRNSSSWKYRPSDTDPGPWDMYVVAAMDKFIRTTELLWRKRDRMTTLSKWERGQEGQREPRPCLDRVLLLFWAHYMRMVLIYYAQVHCRWFPFTDNKGKNAANYFKEKDVTDQGGKWLNWLHSRLGRFSSDFRKLKILSKHLLPQSRVREF